MAIADKLTDLQTTKVAIKNAITAKGQDLTNVPFTQYAEKIAAIESGGGSVDEFYDLLVSRPLDREVELTVPAGIKHLGGSAIVNWYKVNTTYGLRKLNLNEVETIGDSAVQNNQNLIEINAPNLTMFSYDCLYNSRSLTKVIFPNVITAEGSNAFRDCQALKVVDLHKAETLTGSNFVRCYMLDTLIIRTQKVCTLKSAIPATNTCFVEGTARIYVPDDLVEQYKAATNWATYADLIKPLSEYTE